MKCLVIDHATAVSRFPYKGTFFIFASLLHWGIHHFGREVNRKSCRPWKKGVEKMVVYPFNLSLS